MSTQETDLLSPLFTEFVNTVGVANLDDEEVQHLRRFVGWCGGDARISAIYPQQLQTYLEQVSASVADPKPCASVLRRFFAHAHESGWVERNPASGLRTTKRAVKGERRAAPTADGTFISRKRYDELGAELDELKGKGRERISKLLHAAIKDGDLRENAAYDEAKYQQGMLEARVRELEQTLRTSTITDDEADAAAAKTANGDDGIKIGMRVELELTDGSETIAYQLVGPSEVDPLEGKISYLSPVGASLLAKRTGETVAVETPDGSETYRVLSYSF